MNPNSLQATVDRFKAIMSQITTERGRQEVLHGKTNTEKRATLGPRGAFLHWMMILGEETGEVARAYLEGDVANLRTELIQSAAVIIAMLEYGDEDGWFGAKKERSGKERRQSSGRRMALSVGNPYEPFNERRGPQDTRLLGRRSPNWPGTERRKA